MRDVHTARTITFTTCHIRSHRNISLSNIRCATNVYVIWRGQLFDDAHMDTSRNTRWFFLLLCVWCEWDGFMCVDHTVVVLDPVCKRVKRQKGWETRLERLETNRVKQLKTTGCPTRRTFKWSHGSCEAVLSHFNIGFLVLNGFWIFSSEAGFCYWWRFLVKVVFLKYFFFYFFIKTLLCYCCVI